MVSTYRPENIEGYIQQSLNSKMGIKLHQIHDKAQQAPSGALSKKFSCSSLSNSQRTKSLYPSKAFSTLGQKQKTLFEQNDPSTSSTSNQSSKPLKAKKNAMSTNMVTKYNSILKHFGDKTM